MKEFVVVNNLASVYNEDEFYQMNDRDTIAKAISIILDRFHHALDALLNPIPADWLLILADSVAENEEAGQTSACHLLYRHVICSGAFVGADGRLRTFYPPTLEECLKFDDEGFLDFAWRIRVYPTYDDYKKGINEEEWFADMLWDNGKDPWEIEDAIGLYEGQSLFKVSHSEEGEFLGIAADWSIRNGVEIAKGKIEKALEEGKIVPKDLYYYILPVQFAEILSFRELITLLVIESGIFYGGHFEDFSLPESCIVYKEGRLQVPWMDDEAPRFLALDRKSPVERVYFDLPDPERKSYQEFDEIVFDDL